MVGAAQFWLNPRRTLSRILARHATDQTADLGVVDRWGNDLLDGQRQNRSANAAEAVFPRILPNTTGHGEKGIGGPLTVEVGNAGEGRAGTLRTYTLEL